MIVSKIVKLRYWQTNLKYPWLLVNGHHVLILT